MPTRREGWVEIVVRNTGPRIARDDRSRIFERFVRLDASRGRSDAGGLGLPIARWVARAHGGSLGLADEPGEGNTFIVRLPTPVDG